MKDTKSKVPSKGIISRNAKQKSLNIFNENGEEKKPFEGGQNASPLNLNTADQYIYDLGENGNGPND